LLKRMLACDTAFLLGWKDAYARREEALQARAADSQHRKLSDREIFEATGIR